MLSSSSTYALLGKQTKSETKDFLGGSDAFSRFDQRAKVADRLRTTEVPLLPHGASQTRLPRRFQPELLGSGSHSFDV
jgi:hypothetical protein